MASLLLTALGELMAAGMGLLYGLGWLAVAVGYSLRQKEFWQGHRDKEGELFKASNELWSLSKKDGLLAHHFLQLSGGLQLHYLTPQQQQPPASNANVLIIFVHGFPDSAHLFTRQLRSSLANKAQLVALDVPGCGGSDSLPSYGPDPVLNAVAEAIAQLKRQYLQTSDATKRCILVGHDWGGVIGFRIAAETEGLIDHLVTLNSLYPAYAEEVLRRHIARGSDLLSKWQLNDARKELAPVFSQMHKSGYTYMLRIPFPLAKVVPRVASCLIKYAHGMQYQRVEQETSLDVLASRLAMAYGPSSAECTTSSSNPPLQYGPSVLARAQTTIPGDWDGRVRLYADDLLRGKWTPSYTDNRTTFPPIEEADGAQPFKCSVHIIFGLEDVALDPRVVVDGIEKYFRPSSSGTGTQGQIVRLPECGHWSIVEKEGALALDRELWRVVQ